MSQHANPAVHVSIWIYCISYHASYQHACEWQKVHPWILMDLVVDCAAWLSEVLIDLLRVLTAVSDSRPSSTITISYAINRLAAGLQVRMPLSRNRKVGKGARRCLTQFSIL